MTCTKEKLNYIDITDKWLKNAKPNNYKVKNLHYYRYKNQKYFVDDKNVVLDYNEKEKHVASWLIEKFGGYIYMCPRVNNPEGIKTPDYLWYNEFWDLKEIKGNGKHTFDTAIKKKKSQATNFIFDISNSKMPTKEVLRQINLIFKSKDRQWVNKIIIMKKENVIIVVERKKEINHQS